MTTRTLRKSLLLKATPQQVWAYLTEPEKLAVWFNRPDVPLLDGAYTMVKDGSDKPLIWGEVLRAEPFSCLAYTFNIGPFAGAVSTVKWHLEEVPGGTHLSLVHEGLPGAVEAFDLALALDKGWEAHMDSMRKQLHGVTG